MKAQSANRCDLPSARLAAAVVLLGGILAGGAALASPSQPTLADRTEAVISDLVEIRTYVFEQGEPRWLDRLEEVIAQLLERAAAETEPARAEALLDQAGKLTSVAWGGIASQILSGDRRPSRDADRFERLLAGTRALAEAYRRLGRDAGLSATLAPRIDHALAQKDIGHDAAAETELADLYERLKASLVFELDGTTVTRSLNFATAADEYRYELDRHDAHLLMLRQFFPGAAAETAVAGAIAEAARHHLDARQQALSGNYRQAIWVLEHSSEELIRVLRERGLEIPG